MQQALQQLGYPNVYHTRTVLMDRPDDGYNNRRAYAIFWQELLAVYPGAKVILTVYDNVDAWYTSYASTIGYLTSLAYTRPPSATRRWLRRWVFGERWSGFDEMIAAQVKYTPRGNVYNKQATKRWYEEHNKTVYDTVLEEKLLIFNAKQR
ncbi:hypothetical protein UCRPA7_7801 [Phaeoacremonium minimum UCRPA7]|uniref:Uncharacterized protein n=1 Tax=Phaeoacremonium minimum (strain UCR-PA7) TaxID=1286976 RepID=R8BBM6_PHAM7|nr:hypothetical protein UCRPA7_7801 [Phaeoacremonium minimum UCRPA7]EON96695.1 hypothetical protein UCRPA7_7801 [Phaeoacremonium minimum UCRPA7]